MDGSIRKEVGSLSYRAFWLDWLRVRLARIGVRVVEVRHGIEGGFGCRLIELEARFCPFHDI
jgi:hypothetical protein